MASVSELLDRFDSRFIDGTFEESAWDYVEGGDRHEAPPTKREPPSRFAESDTYTY